MAAERIAGQQPPALNLNAGQEAAHAQPDKGSAHVR
jgi:hypothetical protein